MSNFDFNYWADKILIQGQVLGVIIGAGASFIFYKISSRDSKQIQKIVWKKEFDRNQTEPFIQIFKEILLILENNEFTVKTPIPQKTITQLKIELKVVRYFTDELKKEIEENVYQKCLVYNNTDTLKNIGNSPLDVVSASSTDIPSEPDTIVNAGKIECEIRKGLVKDIETIIEKIKDSYSEF